MEYPEHLEQEFVVNEDEKENIEIMETQQIEQIVVEEVKSAPLEFVSSAPSYFDHALSNHDTFFYLDVNDKFNDAAGNPNAEYTSDGVHLLAKYYKEWSEWFCQNTIQK